jgi:hypothetical protein
MRKGTKKIIVTLENFGNMSKMQTFRNYLADYTNAQSIRWGGNWAGMNWTQLSYYNEQEIDTNIF